MVLFISPLKMAVSKVKKMILNLNQYRNTHYRVLNNCKINYKAHMSEQINNAPRFSRIICVYTVYAATHHSFDIGNVCCIHEKFFEDALVELGKLEDDNKDFIPLVVYRFGGIDKDNPRVDIEVLELTKDNLDKVVGMVYDIYKEEGDNNG